MAKVVIYTTKICPYCVRAKMLLQKRGRPTKKSTSATTMSNA